MAVVELEGSEDADDLLFAGLGRPSDAVVRQARKRKAFEQLPAWSPKRREDVVVQHLQCGCLHEVFASRKDTRCLRAADRLAPGVRDEIRA